MAETGEISENENMKFNDDQLLFFIDDNEHNIFLSTTLTDFKRL